MENIKKNAEGSENIQDTYTYIYDVKQNKLILQNSITINFSQTTDIVQDTYTGNLGNTI